eukprot:g5282.t1
MGERDPGSGSVALVLAAMGGHHEAVAALLECGADVDVRDGVGRTALMAAALRGDATLCEALLSAGASRKVQDAREKTAVVHALEAGHLETAGLLRDWRKPAARPETG